MEYFEKVAKNNAYETLIKTYKSRQNNQDIDYDNRLKDKGVIYPSSDYISTEQHKKPTMRDVIKKKGQYMLGGAAGAAAVYAPLAISKSPIKFAKRMGGAALTGAALGLAMSPTKSGMTAKAALSYADKQKYNDFKNKQRIYFKENDRAFEKQDRAAAKDPSILDDLSKARNENDKGLLPQFKTKSYRKAYNDYIKSMNAVIDSSLTNFKSAGFNDEYFEKVASYEDAIMEKMAASAWRKQWENLSRKDRRRLRKSGLVNNEYERWSRGAKTLAEKSGFKMTDDFNEALKALGKSPKDRLSLQEKSLKRSGYATLEGTDGSRIIYSNPKGSLAKGPTKLSRSVNHAIASLHEGDEANSLSTGRYKANYLTGVKMYGTHFNPGVIHKESSRVAIAPLSSRIKWRLLRSTQPIMDIDKPTLKDAVTSQSKDLKRRGVKYGKSAVVDKKKYKSHMSEFLN